MSNNMQALNNVNKVQTPANGGKANPAKKDAELNFNDMFSSALGQNAPKAQLNNIESQLRESLFKQDKSRKNTDNNASAEAAQAAVWAQRNWMQTADVPDIAAQPGGMESPKIAQTPTPQSPAEQSNTQATANAPNQSATQNTQQNSTQGNAQNTSEGAKPSTDQSTQAMPVSESNVQANTTATPASITLSSELNSAPSTDAKLAAMAAESTKAPEALASMVTNSVTNTATTAALSTDNGRAEPKTTAQLKADAALANSTVMGRADLAQTNTANTGNAGNTGNSGNAGAVAAQLGQQISQQAQASGQGFSEGMGEEGLKVGQKILAAGGLQSANAPAGIAAGTNGLTGGTGIAQQTSIKTPVNQAGFAKEMGQTVQWAIGKNLSTVDIRVNPESFGPMNMRLVQKGQQIQLIIRTQDEASANLLTQALGGLKEVLAQNGLQLNQVQIQNANTPPPQGQTNGQTGDQANNGQTQFEQNREQGQGGQHAAGGNKSPQDATPTPTAVTGRKPEGTLDLFA